MEILVGGGVSAQVIREMKRDTGASSFHMSGKITLNSGMIYRKAGVSMGIPGMNEYEIYRTEGERIRQAKEALMA